MTTSLLQHTLDNGLRLVIAPDRRLPVVAVNISYGVGSRHEHVGQHGYAHLLEHMMFQGSRRVGRGEHMATIQAAGGQVNATTNQDRTNYYQTVPVEYLPLVLWLEADRMGGLRDALSQANLDSQRAVVKNEARQRYGNRPYGRASIELLGRLFPPGHPYHHAPIGSMDDVDSATIEGVAAFYEAHYGPDNAVLTTVGDVDPEQVRLMVNHYFGGVPARFTPSPAAIEVEMPPGDNARHMIIDRVPATRVHLAWRIPPMGSRPHHALTLCATALGIGRGSILSRDLVVAAEVAQSSTEMAVVGRHVAGVSTLRLTATGRAGVPSDALVEALTASVDRLQAFGLSAADLDRAQSMVSTRWHEENSTLAGRADRYGEYETLFGDAGLADGELDRSLAVDRQQAVEVARTWLGAGNRVLLSVEPEV